MYWNGYEESVIMAKLPDYEKKILMLKRIADRLYKKGLAWEIQAKANLVRYETEQRRSAFLMDAYRKLKSGGAKATPAILPEHLDSYTQALEYITRHKYEDGERVNWRKTPTDIASLNFILWSVIKLGEDLYDLSYVSEFDINT